MLKIAFLVLLYLFVWRIVRSAARDLRRRQDSMILSPAGRGRRRARPRALAAQVRAGSSSSAARASRRASEFPLDSAP